MWDGARLQAVGGLQSTESGGGTTGNGMPIICFKFFG